MVLRLAAFNSRTSSSQTNLTISRTAPDIPFVKVNEPALSFSSQAHIKGALPAVADMGVVEPDDKRAEFRQSEPQWHLPSEHAALDPGITLADVWYFVRSFAGDNKHGLCAMRLSAMQEAQQRCVRLPLGQSVQIDARVDRLAAARDALFEPPAEWREWRRSDG